MARYVYRINNVLYISKEYIDGGEVVGHIIKGKYSSIAAQIQRRLEVNRKIDELIRGK